jgi:hypothetical protein
MTALRTSAPIDREADLKQLLDTARRMGMSRHIVMSTAARSQYEPVDLQMPVCLGPLLTGGCDESHCYSVQAQGRGPSQSRGPEP